MTPEHLTRLLHDGEGPAVEFKRAREALNRDVYETICAFLNQRGGTLILGAADDGSITGIAHETVGQIRKELVNTLHNSQKINPPMQVAPEQIELNGQILLVLSVPESSQVHSCSNRVFSRNEDGDFDITGHSQLLGELYLRKQVSYSENRIFPFIRPDDLRSDLIERVRHNVRLQRSGHPWAELDDLELLKSARLYQRDYQTGQEGVSMAGALLFGRDEVVLGAVPHHRTDAILRVHDLDRYDDRDDIRTNLIESYDRLMAFVNKHIADPFYLEGSQRVSLRERIFREVVANLLIHREYLNPFPAKLIIQRDRVTTENSNNPHGIGLLRPDDFVPPPKNPAIARVFRELQWAEELGSGVRNLLKYARAFGGHDPVLSEEAIFRVTLILPPVANISGVLPTLTGSVTGSPTQSTTQSSEQVSRLLHALVAGEALSATTLRERLGIRHRPTFRQNYLDPALAAGLIVYTVPDKPASRLQKYRLTPAGQALVSQQQSSR
jgi:ATP-dependent DNA helicase RecG